MDEGTASAAHSEVVYEWLFVKMDFSGFPREEPVAWWSGRRGDGCGNVAVLEEVGIIYDGKPLQKMQ